MNNYHFVLSQLKEKDDQLLCKEIQDCSAEQKRLQVVIELAFSIGYDAGYENGRKSTLPQNTEVPQVKD